MITKAFVLAGHAIFTVDNGEVHYTYRVVKVTGKAQGVYAKPGAVYPPSYYASVRTGAAEDAYTYLGALRTERGEGYPEVALTRSSHYRHTDLAVRVLCWALRVIWADGHWHGAALPERYRIQHEGRCGKCGRSLTNPESIASGIGPVCATNGEGGD